MNPVDKLLNKPLHEFDMNELLQLQSAATKSLKRIAFENLEIVAEQYIHLHGPENGLNELGEDLCRKIAEKQPGGWANLVRHLVTISG